MIKIGIECENLEDSKSRWGVGQLTFNLLKEYSENSELQKKFKLYLYFKKIIPDDDFLKNPIFIKRVLGFPSFNIFYHILMPLRAMADRLDWMFFPAYMLPPLYFGKSIVMLTDDVYYEYKYGNLPFRYRLAYRLFTNWAARFATKIMAISETSKKNIVKLYDIPPNRIFVNYPGVYYMEVQLPYKEVEFPYILYVGQAFPRRHLREIFLAFEKIYNEYPNLKLIAIGPDKYEKPILKSLVNDINRKLGREAIIHKDYVEDNELTKLYTGAKALIYVSDREAFGLPPLEALAFGIPPVIADNELGHELFGEYAFYVRESGPDGIADGIQRALTQSDKIQKIKSEGQEFVKKYNWKNFADHFFEKLNV